MSDESGDFTLPERLAAVEEPNPSYGGWHKFLREHTELREQVAGVLRFGVVNCNYIVFPSGFLVQNYGFNGPVLMADIREKGVAAVEEELRKQRQRTADLIAELRSRDVKMLPGSNIGEFDYGPFSGTCVRKDRTPAKFNSAKDCIDPAKPERWVVMVKGVAGAWREVRIPCRPSLSQCGAIMKACAQFASPEVITPSANGTFGGFIELTG